MKPPRRVITGLDADGRSRVLIDGPAKMVIWSTDETLADNTHTRDTGGITFRFPAEGTLFAFSDFPPGGGTMMHATDTIDYIVVVAGQVTFITETDETVLHAGDVIVDRGSMHGWRNDGSEPCRLMIALSPARPAGKGATVSGEIHA
jgi:quercetin dioxygenase-like cupin family protein